MEYMTSWEEKGYTRGIAIGEQRGEQKGLQQGLQRECALVTRQLVRRFGTLSQRAQTSIARLSFDQLEQLGEALLDFNHPRDLTAWLREQAATKPNGRRTKK